MSGKRLHTVVETSEFQRRAKGNLSAGELNDFVNYIAANPAAGEVMAETGGARKVRWAVGGRGKSGGVRVITFYTGADIPVFLLNVFGKGEKTNLSKAERNDMRKGLKILVANYRT
jgi:hypothetical protein